MGSEWGELDLLPWARQALPEYLISCVRHPADWDSIVARTPWENLAIEIAEVEVDGSISKCGKTHQALLEFDLVIGMRVNVVRQIPYFGEDERHEWPAIVQVLHFEAHSTAAEIAMALDEVPDDFVDEVSWFLREGMGSRYIWHALQAWRAAAFRRWLRMPPPAIEDRLRACGQQGGRPNISHERRPSKGQRRSHGRRQPRRRRSRKRRRAPCR